VIPAGTATLSFWLKIPAASGTGRDLVDVYIDDYGVFRATDANASTYSSYAKVTLDVSQYADGGSHTLEFNSVIYDGPTYFFVDDVALYVQ
jgi:hypothetical protein